MPELSKVSRWAKEKLDALARYLDFYTKVLKNQPWRTIYLVAYAGGGRAVVRADARPYALGPNLFGEKSPIDADARELTDGSPRVARGIAFLDPFGAMLDWRSVEKLAKTGLFEVVVNFALSMAIQLMLPNSF